MHKGQQFGRWTVVRRVYGKQRYRWLCRCECGVERAVYQYGLIDGTSTSCGCGKTKDAVTARPEYWVWHAMLQRCRNPKVASYTGYGARGIRVCPRWDNFAEFIADMGDRPTERHTIERINNDGDYCPENCRWATVHEQSRNKRSNRLLTFAGRTMVRSDWSAETGIPLQTLKYREEAGWSLARILATS